MIALRYDGNRLFELVCRDQFAAMLKKGVLLKSKCIDGAERISRNIRVFQAQFRFNAIGDDFILVGIPSAEILSEAPNGSLIFLRLQDRYSVKAGGRSAVKIQAELTCEDVPESHSAQLAERRIDRKFQTKFRPDEFYELARGFFGYDLGVVAIGNKP